MQPKLQPDVFYLLVPDGVYIRNNHGTFTLPGKTLYKWIERLAPHLDGSRTLAELTRDLPADKQAMVADVVQLLAEHGCIKDMTDDLPHTLHASEEQAYAAEIAFIDAVADSGAHRFERFRESRVLLIGSGLTLTALVYASLRCGLRQVDLLVTDECATNRERHAEYVALLRERDPRQALNMIASPAWDDAATVAATLQPYAAVLHVADRPMQARARQLNQLCISQQKTLIQALIVDGVAWIGPLVAPNEPSCWECGWRRLQANLTDLDAQMPAYAFQNHQADPIDRFLAGPTAGVIANYMSFELFKYLSGANQSALKQQLWRVDLETLTSRSHQFLAHPLCSACAPPAPPSAEQFTALIDQLSQSPAIDQETFSRRAVTWIDPRLGIFTTLDERDFVQLPLNISETAISNPMLLRSAQSITAIGVGTDFVEPRRRAAQRAAEYYAGSLIDRRRLPQPDPAQIATQAVAAQFFDDAAVLEHVAEWTWAYDLGQQQPVFLPAAFAYPALRGIRSSHATMPGLASGLSWIEATCRGLLGCCQRLTLAQISAAAEPFAHVDLAGLPLSARGARYRQLLCLMDAPPQVYDVTGSLGVPTFAVCLGAQTVAYGTHIDSCAAIEGVLELALQYQQSHLHDQPQYAPPLVPQLPLARRGAALSERAVTAPNTWSSCQAWLLEALMREGKRAFAVPLNHDPAFAEVLPFVVHVLVARSAT